MFLLLSFGFLLGGISLLSEWLGGCLNFCKRKRRTSIVSSRSSISSNPRSYDLPTPREKLDSIQYSRSSRMFGSFEDKIIDEQNENGSKDETQEEIVQNHVTPKEDCSESKRDIEVEINEIFNLREIFGEENCDYDGFNEELKDENTSTKNN